jgi:hypothetical protein
MKTLKQKTIIKIVLFMSFILGSFNLAFSQSVIKNESPRFLILIQTTKDGLKLTGQEGCAWKELTFTINQDNPQAIDQFGMTTLKRDQAEKDKNLSHFLFLVQKTQEGISLEGKEGTAWKKLNFSCPDKTCYQYIDFSGMTKKS